MESRRQACVAVDFYNRYTCTPRGCTSSMPSSSAGSGLRLPEQARPRQNIEFFIGLRNKVEHRCQDVLLVATAGMAYAYVINYETEMVARFGASTRSPESSASRSSCTP
jgi:hypothetical protein